MDPSASAYEAWKDLDRAPSPESLLTYLDAFAADPGVTAAKEASLALLGPAAGARVLDVGCGTGVDVVALQAAVATGTAVGVDSSRSALTVARGRALESGAAFVQADMAALPFATGCFDGTRADRVVQHAVQPDVAVAELVRVTRPGGAVVITEATVVGAAAGEVPRPPPIAKAKRLLPFLPALLARVGAGQLVGATSETTVEVADDVGAVLGVTGPVTVRFVHLRAVVGAGQ